MNTGDLAGSVFSGTDLAGLEGDTSTLSCKRYNPEGNVIWDTINTNGVLVDTIYDSATGDDPIEGYELVGGDENDFSLSITISETHAILTRCTIKEDGKDTVSSSAMVYLIGKSNIRYILTGSCNDNINKLCYSIIITSI